MWCVKTSAWIFICQVTTKGKEKARWKEVHLVDWRFTSDFGTGFPSGLGQIPFLSGLHYLSCQTLTSLKASHINYVFSRLRNLKNARHSFSQPAVAKSHLVLCLGKPQTPLNNPAAAESAAVPAANCCGLSSTADECFLREGRRSSLLPLLLR